MNEKETYELHQDIWLAAYHSALPVLAPSIENKTIRDFLAKKIADKTLARFIERRNTDC